MIIRNQNKLKVHPMQLSTDIRKRGNLLDQRLRNRRTSAVASTRTYFDYNWQYFNKQSRARGGCRHIYVTWGKLTRSSCQINESSCRSRHFLLARMRTNIFIIDRFHNSTDIFLPFNCIAEKLLWDRLLRVFNRY